MVEQQYRLGKMFGEYHIQTENIVYINRNISYHDRTLPQVEKILFLKNIDKNKLKNNGDEIEIDKDTFNLLNKILTWKTYPFKSK
jgi:hypothetical protein